MNAKEKIMFKILLAAAKDMNQAYADNPDTPGIALFEASLRLQDAIAVVEEKISCFSNCRIVVIKGNQDEPVDTCSRMYKG